MSLIGDTETGGISFIWTIQNFSYCTQKRYQELESPAFVLRTDSEDKWHLRLFPRGQSFPDVVGLYLQRKSASPLPKNVHFALSIRTSKGQFKKVKNDTHEFQPVDFKGYLCFLNLQELNKVGDDAFLEDGTLTLRCRIWKVDDKSLESGRCYARTIIGVRRSTYAWSLAKFLQNPSPNETNMAEMQPISSEVPFLSMNILLSRKETSADKKVQIEIKQTDAKRPCFSTCEISVLEGKRSIHSERHGKWFEKSHVCQNWSPPFNPESKIIEDPKMLFKCELVVSSGVTYSMVERVEHGKLDYSPSGCSDQVEKSHFAHSWKDDMQRFYSEGRLCDMTIRTPSKDIPVHKAILCARSSVFAAMFERDMNENRTGVVEIEDVDAETISRMLLFVYTDIVEDMEWDSATQLYFAADKYGISALRRMCSDFLKDNIDLSNVCDVLVLADMHQDLDLKSFVQYFIIEHAPEVMGSVEWKKLMKEQLQLASEVMHIFCMRNLKI